MRVEIKTRHVAVTEQVREHIERRLHFALSRFGPELRSVRVLLEDVNGPRGGVDKRCQLTLRGPRVGNITIEEMSADASAAVDIAADRAARALARSLDRARGHSIRLGRALKPAVPFSD
ncbi:MAG: HPF/RaiA family ribosome-associated protein [Myxococcota bacterium]|nr:HPF/RaiA family ribosome-associated protein [Myxococcota bacterium]